MKRNQYNSLADVIAQWRAEDRDLAVCVGEVRKWMKEVEQLGIPHFGEMADRLQPLRDRLVLHFDREDQMISELAVALPDPSAEFDLLRSSADHDHHLILSRLDDFSARLAEVDPPFKSWQTAMHEFMTLVDQLEQHESTESGNIEAFLTKMNFQSQTQAI